MTVLFLLFFSHEKNGKHLALQSRTGSYQNSEYQKMHGMRIQTWEQYKLHDSAISEGQLCKGLKYPLQFRVIGSDAVHIQYSDYSIVVFTICKNA